jgi:hypothetical protein
MTLNKPIVGMAVVPSHGAIITSHSLTDVSCPTATFCAAVDSGGNVITYSGGQWSAPVNIDAAGNQGFASVACPTSTFCIAVSTSEHGFSTYNGTSWSALTQPPAAAHVASDFASVSCANPAFCETISASQGQAAVYFPTYPVVADRWVPAVGANGAIGPTYGARAISCTASGTNAFCLNASGNGSYQTSLNGVMSPVHPVAIAGSASVSCTTATFCVAMGTTTGNANVFNGTSFTATGGILAPWTTATGLYGLSCVGTFCAAIDGANLYTSNGGLVWTAGQPVDAARDAVGISCATSTFCAAVDLGGAAYLLNPSL